MYVTFLANPSILYCLWLSAGRIAARNMLGKEEAFNSIPYFWTVQYGKSLRYCGK